MDLSSKAFNFSNSDLIRQSCIFCGSPGNPGLCICGPCLKELPYVQNSCKKCGNPTPEPQNQCGQCVADQPPYERTITILHYQNPVDYLIQRMKYHNQLEIADLLGKLMVIKLSSLDYKLPEQIIPVPLHMSRLQQRGFNQAVEIARPISKALKIPINLTNCIRTRQTQPQFELSLAERKSNLKNAFEIVHQIKAKHVAVLDDVMTTGSTVIELTEALLNAGVEKVDIWACSRAPLN